MAGGEHGALARGIERIFHHGSLTGLSEGQLLGRFASGDEGAFEALVSRHGPMVLGVCRRMLFDPLDVEDAFQATFLVLLRRAGGIRDAEALGPWLHGVAHRVASRIRSRSARRPDREAKGVRPEAVRPPCDLERVELRALIDEEIRRLPEKYRRPVVLCYLEGRTHEEAARRLRCSAGSVRGRLDRARAKLRDRLIRRGVAPAVGLSAIAAGSEAVSAPMLAVAVATLARAATASAVSGSALDLAVGVLRGMALANVTRAAAMIVGIAAMGAIPMIVAMGQGAPRASASRPASSPPAQGPGQGITLSGRVLDEAGKPIAGARVAWGADLRDREKVPEATTGADGRFAMPGVPPGPTDLTVQATGHAPDLRTVTAGPDSPPVEFRLGPGHTIRGRIVDAHGKPIVGREIAAGAWRGHHTLRWSTRTDAEGRFRWDDAPPDAVLIDLGLVGIGSGRAQEVRPDAPEVTIVLPRPLRVRGRVTDAGTGRPVRPFTLVPGVAREGDPEVSWENHHAMEITGLSYDVTLGTMAGTLRVVRIEADGYLPAVSRRLKDDEEDVAVHFALRRGSGVAGTVRLPDGSPLAGAQVMRATPSQPIWLSNGSVTSSTSRWRVFKSRDDGRFALPPDDPPYAIVVLHDRGYAVREVSARPTAPIEIAIQPWGRVEGSLRIGGRPGGGQPLALSGGGVQRGDRRWVFLGSGFATTDDQGHFTFERVLPGRSLISRLIPFGDVSSAGGSPSAEVHVAPGATTQLVVGGTGRPVVGKAVLPAEVARRDDRNYGFCYLTRKPTDRGRREPAPLLPARESLVFRVEPDGSFRIEDVEPGPYEIQIGVSKRPADGFGPGNEVLALVRREIVVPPIPGGHSDEPLDLGEVRLIAEPPPGAAPAAPKP